MNFDGQWKARLQIPFEGGAREAQESLVRSHAVIYYDVGVLVIHIITFLHC